MRSCGWCWQLLEICESDTTIIQVRTIRYQEIANDLRGRLNSGEFSAGQLLPSEAELGKHYAASRVTIRRSLEELRAEELLSSRQGLGWFVAAQVVQQPLATLSTIEAQLLRSGRTAQRRIVDFKFVDASPAVAAVLGIRVLEVKRINLADGEPFARVTVWCREDLGAELSKSEVEECSFYDLLPVEIGGATQNIGAAIVAPADAKLLGLPESSAVLVVRRTTHDRANNAVLVSEHVFPGHLTEFVAELAASTTHAGVRLLEAE